LYSGVIGAFLSMNEEETWITPNIFAAARWLSQHNCYIKPLVQYISSLSANSQPFPTAYYSPGDVRAPPFQQRDLVVAN
ncbi:655_t:CDS:1, partial [Paraglomus brasilianum]